MIDINEESVFSLSQAAKVLPSIDGRRPHPSTIWRWCTRGIRGVHLEHVRVGGRVCTSADALNRFVNKLAEADSQEQSHPTSPRPRTAERRAEEISAADAELAAAGL